MAYVVGALLVAVVIVAAVVVPRSDAPAPSADERGLAEPANAEAA
jgi:hypothetical protein